MKIRPILIIVPLILLAVALGGGSVLMLRLFTLSILVLLFSYLWTSLSIRGLAAEVKRSSDYCQVGEWFAEEIMVFNKSKVPKLLLNIREDADLPEFENTAVFNLPPLGSYSWQTRVQCRRRGLYRFGALTATVSDPLRFFSLRRKLTEPQSIIVYPAALELPFFEPIPRKELVYGPSLWLTTETGPNAARVREYVNGDRLNHIHWHSTAHTGKLMVKEFDADQATYSVKNVLVIADMHQAVQLGNGETEEYCVTIAASLIKKYIDSDKQVGLIAIGNKSYLFSPQTGSQHLRQMMEALALMRAIGSVPIDQLISQEIERFGTDSAVIVVTPHISEEMLASLRGLRKRSAAVTAILLDPVSFGGTRSMASIARSFVLSGLHVYVVRQGEEMTRALDSRRTVPYVK